MRGKSRVASVDASMSVELLLKTFWGKTSREHHCFLFVFFFIRTTVCSWFKLDLWCDKKQVAETKDKHSESFLEVLHIKTKQSVQALNLHTILYMRRKSREKK